MKHSMRAFCIAVVLSGTVLGAQRGTASERWQDPNACYVEAATFNITTLDRLDYKEGGTDYTTTLHEITQILADDPCIDIHHKGTAGAEQIAETILTLNNLETPADLIIYAQLGSNPYNVYVRSAYEPVRPSLYTCDVDPDYTIAALEHIRTGSALGFLDYIQAYGDAAVVLWHDGCAIAHISPADILATAADLLDPEHDDETTASIVASRFER